MAFGYLLRALLIRLMMRQLNQWQIHFKCRALTNTAIHLNHTAMRLNRAISHGQPKPGTFVHGFGGEKRFKDMLHNMLIYAATVIRNGDADIIASSQISMLMRRFRADSVRLKTNGNTWIGSILNRISGIIQQIHNHLLKQADITTDIQIARTKIALENNIFRNRNLLYFDGLFNKRADFHRFHIGHGFSGKGE